MTGELNPEFARSVLERTPAIIYVYDLKKKRNVFQNRRLGELLDRPPPLALDEEPEWRSLIHPDDAASFPEYHARLANIRPGETLTWQFRMRHANGEWRHFLSHEVLLAPDEQGAPWLIVGDAADITEQKHAEERKNLLLDEMRHRARNFAAVIEGIGRQSLPPTDEATAKFFGTFMGRLRALLDAGDAILASDARTADLVVVAERTLAPFMHSAEPQITISGSSLELSETLAGGLALVIPALVLTLNATRYRPSENATEDHPPADAPAADPGTIKPTPAPPKAPAPTSLLDVRAVGTATDGFRMGVPVPLVRSMYSQREQADLGLPQRTELRLPVLAVTF